MGDKAQRFAVIFGARNQRDWSFLQDYLHEEYTVICADGGLICAAEARLEPDALVGDGDSGGVSCQGAEIIRLPAEKDVTDLQAAIDYALQLKTEQLLITGCTGGRLDHALSAFFLLERLAELSPGCRAMIVDGDNELSFLREGCAVLPNDGRYKYFSVIPADDEILVTITGAKYPLSSRRVARGDSLTVSNEIIGEKAEVTLIRGGAFIIRSQRQG